MEFLAPIQIEPVAQSMHYGQKIMLMGSCFTEHIGNALETHKFDVLQNPNGLLFNPYSVTRSIISYIENQQYAASDLFYLNEVWQSWQYHSRYSSTDQQQTLGNINRSQERAHQFLKEADWLFITLGSSVIYELTKKAKHHVENPEIVANCHRAPAAWFEKRMLEMDEVANQLGTLYQRVKAFNSNIQIVFTVSPVRYLTEGVVNNNRSKARLIEGVHRLADKFEDVLYFPSYELVIDVLRDYRFYDIDFAHPNYQATRFVLEYFMKNYLDEESQKLYAEIQKIVIATKHRSQHPDTAAHRNFLETHYKKCLNLKKRYPDLNFEEELKYFKQND